MCGPIMSRPRRRWDRQCEGFACIVGCGGYREIPLILGATAVGGVGCGRLGATVVLHAGCTPKITHHLRADGSGPMRPQQNPEASLERGPSLPGLCWLSFRRAIDGSAQRRPSWTGARSRTPQSWVGSLGDSKPFDPTAPCGPLRACVPVVGPSHQKIDFNNLHRSTRNPGVYRCIAPNGLLRTGATALRGRILTR